MSKILFLTNIPSPYRVNFFNELGKYCDLTVVFEKPASDERDDSWKKFNFENFNGIIMKGKPKNVDSAFCKEVKKYVLDKSFDKIVCCDYSTPTGIYAIIKMKLHHVKYYLEADGAFKGNGKGLKEKFKRFLIKGAVGCFSTSKITDEYYEFYGAKKDRIYRYSFTSLFEKDIASDILSLKEKQNTKNKLGIKEEKVVLSIGQFIKRKGFDVLLKASKSFSENVGVYFVGGLPTEEYTNFVEENKLKNIHFVGFKEKQDLKDYYQVADVFVLPTREDIWGLVINEAMACGLPVVTTDMCIAGLALVENDKNGYIVPVDDEKSLAEKINYILSNDLSKEKMAEYSLNKIRQYTFENMAREHIKILKD
ncbi:MAG: glycosyltransferase family 4 protein [Clostridia bacterium]|nr:glycosyltransferase family 4 protein [Clostridia bacterium]